jgi:hypothetical protein
MEVRPCGTGGECGYFAACLRPSHRRRQDGSTFEHTSIQDLLQIRCHETCHCQQYNYRCPRRLERSLTGRNFLPLELVISRQGFCTYSARCAVSEGPTHSARKSSNQERPNACRRARWAVPFSSLPLRTDEQTDAESGGKLVGEIIDARGNVHQLGVFGQFLPTLLVRAKSCQGE